MSLLETGFSYEFYEEFPDPTQERTFMWVGVVDERTCLYCYNMIYSEIIYSEHDVIHNFPPHPDCDCKIIEIGVDYTPPMRGITRYER